MTEVKTNRIPAPPVESFDLIGIPPKVFQAFTKALFRVAPANVGLSGDALSVGDWHETLTAMAEALKEAGMSPT